MYRTSDVRQMAAALLMQEANHGCLACVPSCSAVKTSNMASLTTAIRGDVTSISRCLKPSGWSCNAAPIPLHLAGSPQQTARAAVTSTAQHAPRTSTNAFTSLLFGKAITILSMPAANLPQCTLRWANNYRAGMQMQLIQQCIFRCRAQLVCGPVVTKHHSVDKATEPARHNCSSGFEHALQRRSCIEKRSLMQVSKNSSTA